MNHFGVPTLRRQRKATSCAPPTRGAREPCAVRDPEHARKHRVREPGGPVDALAHTKAASRSLKTHGDDGRAREVGPLRSTAEAAEQCRGTGGGGRERGGSGPRGTRPSATRSGLRAGAVALGGLERVRRGSKEGPETAVHGADASRIRHRTAARGVLRGKAGRGGGHRRRDVAALRRRWKHPSPGPLGADGTRGVTERTRCVERTSRRRTGGSGRSAFQRWKIKSFSVPSRRC